MINPNHFRRQQPTVIPARAPDCTLNEGSLRALQTKNIRPKWDDAFRYAGKAAPQVDGGGSPRVPKRPGDVRDLTLEGRADISSKPTRAGIDTTGMITSGTQPVIRTATPGPQQALPEAFHPQEVLGDLTGIERNRIKDSQARRNYEVLNQHLYNHGKLPTQYHLPIKPDRYEMNPSNDLVANNKMFSYAAGQAHELGLLGAPARNAFQTGEFIAATADSGSGLIIKDMAFCPGSSSDLPHDQKAKAKYVTHSHPFTPNPGNALMGPPDHQTDYPSGPDYRNANYSKMMAAARPGAQAPSQEIMMHQHKYFETGTGNGLNFSRIPMNGEERVEGALANLTGPNPSEIYAPWANNPAAHIKAGQPGGPPIHTDDRALPPRL